MDVMKIKHILLSQFKTEFYDAFIKFCSSPPILPYNPYKPHFSVYFNNTISFKYLRHIKYIDNNQKHYKLSCTRTHMIASCFVGCSEEFYLQTQ